MEREQEWMGSGEDGNQGREQNEKWEGKLRLVYKISKGVNK